MEITTVKIEKPDDANVIIGQSHFIKTVEDLYEVIVSAVPAIKFGLAFCEASGACKIRLEGNDDSLKEVAKNNALKLGAGHTFIVVLRNGFPINVLKLFYRSSSSDYSRQAFRRVYLAQSTGDTKDQMDNKLVQQV